MKIGYYHHVSVTLYCCIHVSSTYYTDKLRDNLYSSRNVVSGDKFKDYIKQTSWVTSYIGAEIWFQGIIKDYIRQTIRQSGPSRNKKTAD